MHRKTSPLRVLRRKYSFYAAVRMSHAITMTNDVCLGYQEYLLLSTGRRRVVQEISSDPCQLTGMPFFTNFKFFT